MRAVPLILFMVSGSLSIPTFSFAAELHSPTGKSFPKNYAELKDYVQPASSGTTESAMFGMTRNGGTRFHEGLDIRAFSRDEFGMPSDKVFSVFPGTVAHVCRENNGSYGRYVVLEHFSGGILFYTLYAHLNFVSADISEGKEISAGVELGVLGRSSSVYDFPPGTEHLHFEVGVRLGEESFTRWYDKTFPAWDKNLHAFWNGMNLTGTDPLIFFASFPRFDDFSAWMKSEISPAFEVFVRTETVPEILRFSPGFLCGNAIEKPEGWKVSFSWSGFPVKFVPVADSDKFSSDIEIINVYENYIQKSFSAKMLEKKDARIVPGKNLIRTLDIIFGE